MPDCGKIIELEPDRAEVYKQRGDVYYRLERWAEALQDYNEAVRRKGGKELTRL